MKNDINRLGTAMIIRITEDFIGLTEERALSYISGSLIPALQVQVSWLIVQIHNIFL
jgi:hypothetical protein